MKQQELLGYLLTEFGLYPIDIDQKKTALCMIRGARMVLITDADDHQAPEHIDKPVMVKHYSTGLAGRLFAHSYPSLREYLKLIRSTPLI